MFFLIPVVFAVYLLVSLWALSMCKAAAKKDA